MIYEENILWMGAFDILYGIMIKCEWETPQQKNNKQSCLRIQIYRIEEDAQILFIWFIIYLSDITNAFYLN